MLNTYHILNAYHTMWLFNMAMDNDPFIDDFPIKISIYSGFSMAMLNNQMVFCMFLPRFCMGHSCLETFAAGFGALHDDEEAGGPVLRSGQKRRILEDLTGTLW